VSVLTTSPAFQRADRREDASRPVRGSPLDKSAQLRKTQNDPYERRKKSTSEAGRIGGLSGGKDFLRSERTADKERTEPERGPEGKKHAQALLKQARSKLISTPVAAALTLETHGTASPLFWAYGRSLACAETKNKDEDGKLTSHYCKNRWCPTCGRIRTARLIDQYGPVLKAWKEPHLVTLTARAVRGPELEGRVREFLAVFNRCKDSMRKDGRKLIALRSAECTYNEQADTYHYHYHVAVDGEADAYALTGWWLTKWGDEAEPVAQDVRQADPERLNELFKYTTKLLCDKRPVPPKNLDVIYCALRGTRLVQPVGFKAPTVTAEQDAELMRTVAQSFTEDRPGEIVAYSWDQESATWVDQTTGVVCVDYSPSEPFRALCDTIASPEDIRTAQGVYATESGHRKARKGGESRTLTVDAKSGWVGTLVDLLSPPEDRTE